MRIKAITFTLLTVGSAEPVAEGRVESESDGQLFQFTLCWDERPELQISFAPEFYQMLHPTQRELNALKTDILHQYGHILRRALYGNVLPTPHTVQSSNLKMLRLGNEFSRETSAIRLDVRTCTISAMENGSFDFEADIWKYVDPSDSLLFRAAVVYHVPLNAVWELSSPHFFLRNRIKGCSYDFGSKSFHTRRYPFRKPGTENPT